MDLPHRAERKFSLPIVHVVAEPTAAPAISSPFSIDTILVPLDDILSEVVLGPVGFLARRLGSRVTLVHVSEKGLDDPSAGGAPEVVGQGAVADPIAERYLYRGADTLRKEGVAVDTLVLTGKADRAIVDWARMRNYGLVAMATYSRGGGARTEPGHVTTQVLRACPVPLLLSGPGNGGAWAAPCNISRLLVPLDGSPLAEEALPYAAQLALKLALPLTLIRVISASRQPVAAFSEPVVNNIEPRPVWRQSFSDHPLQGRKPTGRLHHQLPVRRLPKADRQRHCDRVEFIIESPNVLGTSDKTFKGVAGPLRMNRLPRGQINRFNSRSDVIHLKPGEDVIAIAPRDKLFVGNTNGGITGTMGNSGNPLKLRKQVTEGLQLLFVCPNLPRIRYLNRRAACFTLTHCSSYGSLTPIARLYRNANMEFEFRFRTGSHQRLPQSSLPFLP
jgi:nucleotide-binding universal stress UspA family protein